MQGRNGDMLLNPFQCDVCWFRNLKNRNPNLNVLEDKALMSCIRRVNLDMLWSVNPATVQSTLSNVRKGIKMSKELGIAPTFSALGPWPLRDEIGFSVGLQMVKASLSPGRHDVRYQQFDTVRAIRSAYSNVFESSAGTHTVREVLRGDKGVVLHPSRCPTQSLWFEKFSKGMLRRMGRDVRSNAGLNHLVLLEMVKNVEEELRSGQANEERQHFLVTCMFYFMVSFGASLRGSEGFMIERSDLIRHIGRGKLNVTSPHVVVPLLGRFKGETGERSHLLILANTTSSGLQLRTWVERMVGLLERTGQTNVGPAICDKEGELLPSYLVDLEFKAQIEKVQKQRPDLIEESVDVNSVFAIYRSLRRGSQTRATEAGVDERTIDLINRWRKNEDRRMGAMPMRDHYLDMQLVLEKLLKYSRAL